MDSSNSYMPWAYILVKEPDSDKLMTHKRFKECLLVQDMYQHTPVGVSAYMAPFDLYMEIFKGIRIDLGVNDYRATFRKIEEVAPKNIYVEEDIRDEEDD